MKTAYEHAADYIRANLFRESGCENCIFLQEGFFQERNGSKMPYCGLKQTYIIYKTPQNTTCFYPNPDIVHQRVKEALAHRTKKG